MDYVKLGKTDLYVSRLCFGGLTVGPLQVNMPIEEGARIIAKAFDMGVNFIDTAVLYKTYPYIKRAMEISRNKDIVISSKSYDYTYEGMKETLNTSLRELGVNNIGIFSLHEQESKYTLKGHKEALDYLVEARESGIIQAVGVSTHSVEVVREVCKMNKVDVIHPIVNYKGLGIIDGNVDDMLEAIQIAYECGKGIYSMKPLGGGNLSKHYKDCFDFVLNNKYIHSVAVGMQNEKEILANIALFEGRLPDEETNEFLINRNKKLHIDDWCTGCGKCISACKNNALDFKDGKAHVISEKCVLCGYCSAYCADFCIKII